MIFVRVVSPSTLLNTQGSSRTPIGFGLGMNRIMLPLLREFHVRTLAKFIRDYFGEFVDLLLHDRFIQKYGNHPELLDNCDCVFMRIMETPDSRLLNLEDGNLPRITLYPKKDDFVLVLKNGRPAVPCTMANLEIISPDILWRCLKNRTFTVRTAIEFFRNTPFY